MSDALKFIEGSAYTNALNSIVEASLEEQRQAQLERIANNYESRIATLNANLDKGQELVDDLGARIYADSGLISLLDEEVIAADKGMLPTARLSDNKPGREAIRKELARLSSVDRELAMEGGRFSRTARQHLYDRLRSRIQEFVEYGVEHKLTFLTAGRLKPTHVQEFWKAVDTEAEQMCNGRIQGKILYSQKAMNMLYVESTPRQEEFKPVNLIEAMGFTVAGLSKEVGIDTKNCPYTNPPCDFKADVSNNQILEAARKDADAFEREFEAEIRKNCANAEAEIVLADRCYADDSAKRLAAKLAMANYWLLRSEMSAEH
jgi:hypothetical protein